MPIAWNCEQPGLMVYTVTGELGIAEMSAAQQESDALINRSGNWKILVLLQDFSGWSKEKGWGSASLLEENDEHVDRMALVGDIQWRDQVEMFTLKGMRPVEIEFFTAEDDARAWLGMSG
jgi:hypothetical protein